MANDFTGDLDFVAGYGFNTGGLGTDFIGSFDMSLNNVNSPSIDTGDFKEGDASGAFDLSNTEGMDADANASAADMPFRTNSNRVGTILAWFKTVHDFSTNQTIAGRYSVLTGGYALQIIVNTTPDMQLNIGYNNGSSGTAGILSHTVVASVWNHVAASYDVADDSWHIRLYDGDDDTVYDDAGIMSQTMDLQNNTWEYSIGADGNAANFFDGNIDEVLYCKRVLTNDEIDQIRQGIFGAAPEGGSALFLGSNF